MNIVFSKVEHSKRLSEMVLAASEELRGIDFNEEGWERFVNSNTTSEFEAKLSKSEFSIFCCVESNCIIGFLSLKDNEKIDQLFVAPEARNRGVASSLWKRAKKNAIENSSSGMFWVRSSSVAIPVYQKFGFMCEGNRQSFGGINFQLMRLEVNS